MSTWNILYRGSLSSCNYACGYCPFAKTSNTNEELERDQAELERFVDWVGSTQNQKRRIGILITPWGEALVHSYYRRAMTQLSSLSQVYRIAAQTNASAPIDDFVNANRDALALWTTFHPSQTTLERFVARCLSLDTARIRYSVGVVGLREHFPAIENLRTSLRPEVYLWINAYKRDPAYYRSDEIEWLSEIDPYFHWNTRRYPSLGQSCRAGDSSFTVDGKGDVRRCHFISEVIGNIYDPDFADYLKPRPCSAETCGCHIGYIHRPRFNLNRLYGDGLLERIPAAWPEIAGEFSADSFAN